MSKKISVKEIQAQPRSCENFIKDYLTFTDSLEAPKQFHIWAALHAISGALGGKCYFNMQDFVWKPNLYIVFVAPPGVISKSTTANIGCGMLKKVPGINYGPGSATWQALFEYMTEHEQTYSVGKGKNEKQSHMNLNISEFGRFMDFSDGTLVDTMVSLWDCEEEVTRSTMGGGEKVINNPYVNMIGCTTPAWIQQSVPEYAIGGGFVSRTIFVYGEKKEKLIAYPFLEKRKANHEELKHKLLMDLIRISGMKGEFTLSEEALALGLQWYDDHEYKRPKHLQNPVLQGYAARKQVHMHKIAMCLSAAESNDMIIHKRHLKAAMSLLSNVERDMMKVFEVMSDDRDARNVQELIRVLTRKPEGFSEMELKKLMIGRLVGINFDRALQAGLSAGILDKPLTDETVQKVKLHRNYRRDLESGKISAKDLALDYMFTEMSNTNDSDKSEVS